MHTIAFIQNINGPEILLIFLIVLLLFGAKRLPDLFKSFGKSIREFKKATSEIEDDFRTAMDEVPSDRQSTPAQSTAQPEPTQVVSESVDTGPVKISEEENPEKG